MTRADWVFAALAFAPLTVGCKPLSPVARLQLTSQPLAPGCYAQARIVDASLTTKLASGTVASASLSDPSLAQLLGAGDLPSEFPTVRTADRVYLKALAPGMGTLTVDAEFDDGTKRSAVASLGVRAADKLELQPACDPDVALPLRVPAGAVVVFDAVASSGGRKLAGYCPDAFVGDQVGCRPYTMDIVTDTTRCQWTAPASGGGIDISSPSRPTFSARLETYLPTDVTAVTALTSSGTRNIGVSGKGGGVFTAYVSLAGGRPCKSSRIQVKTLTPSVCAGPSGEAMWTTADDGGMVSYTSLAEGQCQLGLGAAGAPTFPSVAQFSTRVATDFTAAHTADSNAPCPKQGATACFPTLLGVVTCRGGGWSQPSLCADGQACEVSPNGSNGCTEADGCARCR
jgi:hypothetical protein